MGGGTLDQRYSFTDRLASTRPVSGTLFHSGNWKVRLNDVVIRRKEGEILCQHITYRVGMIY
jgi:hypothetical protein